jgi:hypothetical protein
MRRAALSASPSLLLHMSNCIVRKERRFERRPGSSFSSSLHGVVNDTHGPYRRQTIVAAP